MTSPYTDLETSQILTGIAEEKVSGGMGAWLAEHRRGVCPVCSGTGQHEMVVLFNRYVHALTWLEALDFCEQVLGYEWGRVGGDYYWARKYEDAIKESKASGLVGAILAEVKV